MRTLGRKIATGIAGLTMGLGLVLASGGAAAAAGEVEPPEAASTTDVEASKSWIYFGAYATESECVGMGIVLVWEGGVNDVSCQFYPGHPHLWKLYYK